LSYNRTRLSLTAFSPMPMISWAGNRTRSENGPLLNDYAAATSISFNSGNFNTRTRHGRENSGLLCGKVLAKLLFELARGHVFLTG